jgi:hypothetical protein
MTKRTQRPLWALVCSLLAGACVSKAPPTDGSGGSGGTAPSTAGRGGSNTSSGAGGAGTSGGTSGGTGTGGTGSIPPPTGSEPLPETTFAFFRDVREGTTWKASHLYSIDLNTKAERLITTFPESGGTGAPVIAGLAVSPDRRQLAFGSAHFRPTIEDKLRPFQAGMLWAVSSDGRTFTRLTPVITEDYHLGNRCGAGVGSCGYGESCDPDPGGGHRCVRPNLTVGYGYPAWSADGKTVFFSQTISWICAGFNNPRPCWIGFLRSVSGGQVTGLAADGACTGQVPGAISPSGDLLISRTSCDSMSGLHERDATTQMPKRLLVADTVLPPYFKTWSPQWLPGSSTLIFHAQGDKIREGTPRRRRRSAIYTWSESGGVKLLFEPSDEVSDPVGITVSKTGKGVVAMAHQEPPNENTDLYEFDTTTGTLGARLTTSGTSNNPRW